MRAQVRMIAAVAGALAATPAMAGVVIEDLATPGLFAIHVGQAPVELSDHAIIEIQTAGRWIKAADVSLGERCTASAKFTCASIRAGATIHPVRWDGLLCSGLCGGQCKANPYAGPGVARLTVTDCRHTVEFHGAPFTLPRRPVP